jgi:hypothetical protein
MAVNGAVWSGLQPVAQLLPKSIAEANKAEVLGNRNEKKTIVMPERAAANGRTQEMLLRRLDFIV